MATESPKSSNSAEQNPGPESTKPVDGNGQDVKHEVANDTSERPFFAPSEPLREDQVQNAVKFLSHPKVRGSPVIYRRSFLEKKGLTKEEIDEAFRRVPDPPSNASTGASATSQASQQKPSASLQPQAPSSLPQPAASPVSNNSLVPSTPQSRFHWSHALIAVGALAASGAGTAVLFKKLVVPRLKTWIKKVVAEKDESEEEDKSHSVLAEQTAEAAKAAATAAAVVAKASEELLNSKNEERKYFDAFMGMMDVQVKEMKTMGEAIRKLESTKENSYSQSKRIEEYIQSTIGTGTTNNAWRTPEVNQWNMLSSVVQKEAKVNGTPNPDNSAVRGSSAPATMEPTAAPYAKSYMEPWEVPQQRASQAAGNGGGLSSGSGENSGSSHGQSNGQSRDVAEPWWRKKTVKITEIDGEGKESRQEQQFPYSAGGSSERPVQRGWVPPQPPSVVIPEAAVAIRQPKSSVVQKQQSGEMAIRSEDDGGGEETSRRASDDDVGVEPETSSSSSVAAFRESTQSEIEEVQE